MLHMVALDEMTLDALKRLGACARLHYLPDSVAHHSTRIELGLRAHSTDIRLDGWIPSSVLRERDGSPDIAKLPLEEPLSHKFFVPKVKCSPSEPSPHDLPHFPRCIRHYMI